MRPRSSILLGSVLALGTAFQSPASRGTEIPPVRPNANLEPAGKLEGGTLRVTLEAKPSLWHFNERRSPLAVAAFAEPGRPPLMPAPLLRAPAGTTLEITVRNALPQPLTFLLPASVHGGPDRLDAMDSIIIAPGDSGRLTARADVPGNYVYRGKIPDGVTKVGMLAGLLSGAIVVDSAGAPAPPRDRVFVIMATEDSASAACDDTATVNPLGECRGRRFMYTLNGTSWPGTERIHATVGDSLHWRVINASFQVHPMHLHGFYYRVDGVTGPLVDAQSRPAPGQLVVTQLLTPLAAMSLTWSPDRPGNWLFHCHFTLHNTSYRMLATPDDPAGREMIGLLLGTVVAPGPLGSAARAPTPARRLRLLAEEATPQAGDTLPAMRFVIDDNGRRSDTRGDWSPELDLIRGEPVAITIVNDLREPTSVHWHGIEVEESYMDGAAGFGGTGSHLAPSIAPGDSFVARFTPPRAGTFMYHAHVDEMREELAGLGGPLIVRDAAPAARDDHVFFLKGAVGNAAHPLEIDGEPMPDTVVLHVGVTARLRLLNLTALVPPAAAVFSLSAPDSATLPAPGGALVDWRLVAKDGFDVPVSVRTPRPARQVVSVGETYDFEFTPQRRGTLRLDVSQGRNPRPLIGVPIRVE